MIRLIILLGSFLSPICSEEDKPAEAEEGGEEGGEERRRALGHKRDDCPVLNAA